MIDIHSKKAGVAGKLSNFTKRYFVFDGVPCACLEGPIQAFKYKDPEIQKEICMLSGRDAKLRGQEKNEEWQASQMLWWMGKKYPRGSEDFHELLKRLFLTAYFNEKSASDLMDSNFSFLSHNIGGKDQTKTVLTEAEFCFILMWTRETIREREKETREEPTLSVEEMNEAAKLIEVDGLEAFYTVKKKYGKQVARLLTVAHSRWGYPKESIFPPDENMDKTICSLVSKL